MPAENQDELRRAVEDLAARVEAGDPGEDSECRERLHRLRELYRRNSDWFAPETVSMLRRVASTLESRARSVPPQLRHSPESVLTEVFGYDEFRRGQKELIDCVLSGGDAVGIMPTGAGKSLTFQIPARALGGVTLVVSPLIALMKDQVDALTEVGMRATFLNSSLTPDEREDRVRRLQAGEFELVYAAPEGLLAGAGRALGRMNLSLIAVDEAHCISQWGHDFRPAYRELRGLKRRFGDVPMLALTATATPAVTDDIVEQLAMQSPALFRGSFFRSNLHVHAFKKGGEDDSGRRRPAVRDAILRLIQARAGQSGIVYCLSRKTTESTADHLASRGIRAAAYHAGMTAEQRTKVQDAFRDDDIDVVVATIAFGMGIDKSNVRFVIHRDMPRSVEGYYQEIGRAGRDGVESDCVLFYSWSEVIAYDRFTEDVPDDVAMRQRLQAREMYRFAESPGCRHQRLVGYFAEEMDPCGASCDACTGVDLLARTRSRSPRAAGTAIESELFDRLKGLRKELARARGVPAYLVFSDATLLEMAARRPASVAELAEVPGVGPKKLRVYGAAFLSVLQEST